MSRAGTAAYDREYTASTSRLMRYAILYGIAACIAIAEVSLPLSARAQAPSRAVASETVLHANVIGSDPYIVHPWLISADSSYIWVLDAAGDPFVHAIDRKTGKRVVSLGKRGREAGEFASVLSITKRQGESGAVWVYDPTLHRLTRLAIKDRLGRPPQYVEFPPMPSVHRAAWLGSSLVVGIAPSDRERFAFLDEKGRLVNRQSGWLPGPDSIPEFERGRVSNGVRLCARPDGREFALAYFGASLIEIYSADAKKMHLAEVPAVGPPLFKWDSAKATIRYKPTTLWYADCAATNTVLIALYAGEADYVGRVDNFGSVLHVFGWDGQLRAVIRLDRSMTGIDVSEDGRTLFAVSADGAIATFQLPAVTKEP